jgi:DNA-binding MarR family transcriptional regulator
LETVLRNVVKKKYNFTRMAILLYLAARGEVTFNKLYKELGLTPGNAWSHLERLEREGLIKISKKLGMDRVRTTIKLTEEGAKRVDELLEMFESLAKLGDLLSRAGKGSEGPERD